MWTCKTTSSCLWRTAFSQIFCLLTLQKSCGAEILHCFLQSYTEAGEAPVLSEDGQPVANFLHHVRIFHPHCVICLSPMVSTYTSVPGLADVPPTKLTLYTTKLAPEASVAAGESTVELDVFWSSVKEQLPSLTAIAQRYVM